MAANAMLASPTIPLLNFCSLRLLHGSPNSAFRTSSMFCARSLLQCKLLSSELPTLLWYLAQLSQLVQFASFIGGAPTSLSYDGSLYYVLALF